MEKLIEIKGLHKVYRTDEVETTALNNVELNIGKGEFVAVMGPSGCGKSTLLNVLGLLDSTDRGSYLLSGEEMVGLNEKERANVRKNNIGFVFQSFNLIDELTVFENIELPLIYLKVSASERKERVLRIMEQMSIAHREKHYPQQLSGGQQQRVAVARALVSNPKMLLADEPTGNLDTVHGNEVMDLLSGLHQQGTTIVMVTHSQHDASYANRIIRLLDGSIISENAAKSKAEII